MKWWAWFTVGFDLACLGCWLEAGTLSVGRMLFLVVVMLAIAGTSRYKDQLSITVST
jgi:hypothetical protein